MAHRKIQEAANDAAYARDPLVDQRLRKLVMTAEIIARKQYASRDYPKFDFASPRWDLNKANLAWQVRPKYAHFYDVESGSNLRSRVARESAPRIPGAFADVIKAWLIHSNVTPDTINARAQASRELWRALKTVPLFKKKFTWDRLTPQQLTEAAKRMEERIPKSAGLYESAWLNLVRWLESNEVLSDGFDWKPSALNVYHHSRAGIERRAKKIPRPKVLSALAEIYRVHAVSRIDRLLICALGILLTCGFRLSELLALPLDCLVHDVQRGKHRWGIRYWRRKTKNGAYVHAIRWLSPLGAELAKACLKEILKITKPAREQARRLEANPDRVNIPYFGRRTLLTRHEAARALGLNVMSIPPLIRNDYLKIKPVVKGYRKWYFYRSDVERELLRRRPPLRTFHISGRKYQKLSETLLIIFVNETDPHVVKSPLLVRDLSASAVNSFIGANEGNTPSAFSRFGLHDPFASDEGDLPLRLHTHMVRHWLNTVANKAGMSAFQITLWMGRDSILQTKLYLHPSSEIAEIAREGIKDGSVVGIRSSQYAALDVAQRSAYLRLINHGHKTSNGFCLEDIKKHECLSHKNCGTTCSFFLAVVGDRDALPALAERRRATNAALLRIDSEVKRGRKIVGRQRRLCLESLSDVEKLQEIAAKGE